MFLDSYVIKNYKNVYICLNENGRAITCPEQQRSLFDYHKAMNILASLPKTLKKMNFKVEPIIETNIKKDDTEDEDSTGNKVLESKDYIPSENITRWINKFGVCGDILNEAEEREKELIKELENSDKELLDLLHIIEIEKPKDLFSGWKLYKQIKENRTKRRDVKDEILIVENVLENIKTVSCMHRDKVQKAIDGLSGRKYRFRIIEEDEENASL